MGRIFYSVAGEGRGHATRVRTVVEELRQEHDVVLLAPHVAFEFLDDVYHDADDVEVRRIPGLQFCYNGRRVSYFSSIRQSVPYLRQLPELVNSMERMLRDEQPDLIITDFEPALPQGPIDCALDQPVLQRSARNDRFVVFQPAASSRVWKRHISRSHVATGTATG